jgi:hypothetical protein
VTLGDKLKASIAIGSGDGEAVVNLLDGFNADRWDDAAEVAEMAILTARAERLTAEGALRRLAKVFRDLASEARQ